MATTMCPHGTNPACCPTCFRLKPPEPPPANPALRPGIPMGQVMAIGEATMRATMRRGTGHISVPTKDGKAVAFKEPFSYARPVPPEAYGGDKQWEPQAQKSLIDSLPRHPHADAAPTAVTKI